MPKKLLKAKDFLAKNNYIPFVVFFLVLLLFSVGLKFNFSDDAYMVEYLKPEGPFRTALKFRREWSSRLIIELSFLYAYYLPNFLWKILNSSIYVLAAYSLSRLLNTVNNRRLNWLACGAVLLYPMTEMITAGWHSGGMNYIWPLALGLYCITPWRRVLSGESVPLYTYALSLLALLYGGNVEQMAAILVGLWIIALLYMVYNQQKPNLYQIIWTLTFAALLVVMVTAPGPAYRLASETALYYPNFAAVHTFTKLYDCYMLFSAHFIGVANLAMLFCTLMVAVAVFKLYKDFFYRLMAAIPVAVTLALGPLYPLTVELYPALGRIPEKSINQFGFTSLSSYVPFALYGIVWLSLLVSTYLAFSNRRKGVIMAIVLLAGLCSQMVLSFSPSVVPSSPRFFIYLHFALLIIGLGAIADFAKWKDTRYYRFAQYATCIISVFSLLQLFLSL